MMLLFCSELIVANWKRGLRVEASKSLKCVPPLMPIVFASLSL